MATLWLTRPRGLSQWKYPVFSLQNISPGCCDPYIDGRWPAERSSHPVEEGTISKGGEGCGFYTTHHMESPCDNQSQHSGGDRSSWGSKNPRSVFTRLGNQIWSKQASAQISFFRNCRFMRHRLWLTTSKFNSSKQRLAQTPHHRPAKTVFSTVPRNSDWQWTVELWAGWRGVPLSTVSRSCKEQLKIGLLWPVVWRWTFSGVGRMITCRRLNILSRVNTKGKWQIQRRMHNLRSLFNLGRQKNSTFLGILSITSRHWRFSIWWQMQSTSLKVWGWKKHCLF